MIKVRHKGDLSRTTNYLKRASKVDYRRILNRYGVEGVSALASATPKDSGETAASWHYRIEKRSGQYGIVFYNDNVQNGVPIAILIQYSHGTGNGGWVEGRDYINPAIQPIFDKIADMAWREVTGL